jgi:hypothetical protein
MTTAATPVKTLQAGADVLHVLRGKEGAGVREQAQAEILLVL